MFQLQLQFAAISAAVCCLLSTGLAQDSKCFRQFVFDYCLVEWNGDLAAFLRVNMLHTTDSNVELAEWPPIQVYV